jgi:competence protein ComEC
LRNTLGFFKQAPFIRLLLPLMAGISIRLIFTISSSTLLWLLFITFIVSFCLTIFNKLSSSFKLRWVSGLSFNIFIFCLGIYLTGEKYKITNRSITKSDVLHEYTGIIVEAPEKRLNSVRCIIKVSGEKAGNSFSGCKEKILCYIQKDSASFLLKSGDALIFRTIIEEVDVSGNPYEFNYKKYLSYQGIRFSAYINNHSWQLIARDQLPVLQLWANRMREKLISVLSKAGVEGDELGVASALIIGDKTGLDDEIKQAYVASGTMHILAVSGMHVALLYWVLNMLLSFLDRNKYSSYLKLIILLCAVWMYAMITGLAGSILRASIMITFVILGKAMNRWVNIFNSLGASAFFILIFDPYSLVDVGFQLSYAAVFSIVIFYPLIYNLIKIENRIGDQVWSITAVTLSAQILTFPISLFYFHQFPNLFLISNLIMIPLSTLIMYFAMLLISCSGWLWLCGMMGKVFNFMVWLLNKVVLTIEGLPYALTKGIYISWTDVCLLYILICFFTLYLLKRRAIHFILALSAVLVFILFATVKEFNTATRKEIIVYHENNNTIIQFCNGQKSVWLAGENTQRIESYIERAHDAMQSKENKVLLIDSVIYQSYAKGKNYDNWLWIRGNFIQFDTTKIFITGGKNNTYIKNYPVKINYVLYRKTEPYDSKGNLPNFNTSHIIIDASYTKTKAKKIEKILLKRDMNVYNVQNSGALNIKLSPL